MSFVFLLACAAASGRCDVEEHDIADEELVESLDATAATILGVVARNYSLPAAWGESTVRFDWRAARGEGSAVHVVRTFVETGRSWGGLEDFSDPDCVDTIRVPVVVTLTTADGALDTHGELPAEARAYSDVLQTRVDGALADDGTLAPADLGPDTLSVEFDPTGLTRAYACELDGASFAAPPDAQGCG